MIYLIVAFLTLFPVFNFADEAVFEKVLSNGMKVVLRPGNERDEEVLIQLLAEGGFASLETEKQLSGRLACDIVGGFESAKLYDSSSELQASIQPLYRKIEGTLSKGNTKVPLEMIYLMFTKPHLSDSDLKEGLDKLKFEDHEWSLDLHAKCLNTRGWAPFCPLSAIDRNKIDLNCVRQFYRKAFLNPKDFLCVIVGDFDQKTLLNELSETLEKIPSTDEEFYPRPSFPSFPEGIKELNIMQKGRPTPFCRLTFPVQIQNLEWMTRHIEVHLNNTLMSNKNHTTGLDVSYEFPFFPYLDSPWLILQFYAPAIEINRLEEQVLQQLSALQKEDSWKQDNDYWLMTLSNPYWKLSEKPRKLTYDLEHYTKIVIHP